MKVSKRIQVTVEVVCEKVFLIRLAAVELAQRVFKDGRQNKIFQRQFFEISCTVENFLVSLAVLNASFYNEQVNGNKGIRPVIFHEAYLWY